MALEWTDVGFFQTGVVLCNRSEWKGHVTTTEGRTIAAACNHRQSGWPGHFHAHRHLCVALGRSCLDDGTPLRQRLVQGFVLRAARQGESGKCRRARTTTLCRVPDYAASSRENYTGTT